MGANLCLTPLGHIWGSHAHCGQHFPSRILTSFQFVIAACHVRSLIAEHMHSADACIMERINTSAEVTYFPLDVHTVGDEIMYLSTMY